MGVGVRQSRRHGEELRRLAVTDPLTGLLNVSRFHEVLGDEVARARRHDRPLSLAVLDIDHFKRVNDTFGHPVGDRVLMEVARRLQAIAREGESLGRLGGEEFGWILPDANGIGGYAAIERARRAIGATPIPGVGRLTISAGVCELGDAGAGDRLYPLADRALYWAKRHGRDRSARYSRAVEEELGRPVDVPAAAVPRWPPRVRGT